MDRGKIGYFILKAFIIYIINVRLDIIALYHEYKRPIKALLADKNPTQILKKENIRDKIYIMSLEAPKIEFNLLL